MHIKHFHSFLHVFLPSFCIFLLFLCVCVCYILGNFIRSIFHFTNFSFQPCLICCLTCPLSFFFLKDCFPIYKLHLVLFQICLLFTQSPVSYLFIPSFMPLVILILYFLSACSSIISSLGSSNPVCCICWLLFMMDCFLVFLTMLSSLGRFNYLTPWGFWVVEIGLEYCFVLFHELHGNQLLDLRILLHRDHKFSP